MGNFNNMYNFNKIYRDSEQSNLDNFGDNNNHNNRRYKYQPEQSDYGNSNIIYNS